MNYVTNNYCEVWDIEGCELEVLPLHLNCARRLDVRYKDSFNDIATKTFNVSGSPGLNFRLPGS